MAVQGLSQRGLVIVKNEPLRLPGWVFIIFLALTPGLYYFVLIYLFIYLWNSRPRTVLRISVSLFGHSAPPAVHFPTYSKGVSYCPQRWVLRLA